MAKRTKVPAGSAVETATLTVPVAAEGPAKKLQPTVPSAAVVAPVVPMGGMAAMMAAASAGGAAEVAKVAKKGTPEIEVSDVVKEQIQKFVYAAARKKSAEGEMASQRPYFEDVLKDMVVEKCRKEGVFNKSVSVAGLISFSQGKLGLERPTETRSAAMIEADLRRFLGELYDKYVKSCMSLSIKSSALDGYDKTMATLKLLQEKLGADFGVLFDFSGYLELKERALGTSETTEQLTYDYVLDRKFASSIQPAIETGTIRLMNVTVSPKSSAIASAGERLAEEASILLAAKAAKAKK